MVSPLPNALEMPQMSIKNLSRRQESLRSKTGGIAMSKIENKQLLSQALKSGIMGKDPTLSDFQAESCIENMNADNIEQDDAEQCEKCQREHMCPANANRLSDEVERAEKDFVVASQLISRAFEAIFDSLPNVENGEGAQSWVQEIMRQLNYFEAKVEETLDALGKLP
jgi:hypothetical protein